MTIIMYKMGLYLVIVAALAVAGCNFQTEESISQNQTSNKTPANNVSGAISTPEEKPQASSTPVDESLTAKVPNYIGCWRGMGGGMLHITADKVYDIGSKEESDYEIGEINPSRELVGMQTGEEYLLKAKKDFPKSFLAKIILFGYNSDGTVRIVTYDTYEEYLADKMTGMGLFEKVDCAVFEKRGFRVRKR